MMWGIIYKLIIFIISGVIFRLLASIGFGLATQAFVGGVVDDYLQKGMKSMNALLSPQIAAYMHLARVDDCVSILMGAITFIATYKSLKLMFVRQL